MPTTTSSHIHIRRLEFSDFAFVRGLASEQPNFTIPPPYVLWLLLKVHKNVCLVAEDDRVGPVAYLLAIPVLPPDSLYVWQLAASDKGKRVNAARHLLQELRRQSLHMHIRRVMFSTLPKSPMFRAIRRYAAALFGARLEVNSELPSLIAPGESEYRVELARPKSRRQPKRVPRDSRG
jgi:hypothetical protein